MRKIYENYSELADLCCVGDGYFHGAIFNKHDEDPCIAWQQGVRQFATMLDEYAKFPKEGVELK